jgi:hypothetical protein
MRERANKLLCHDIVVVHKSQIELGIGPVSWQDQEAAAPGVLPMVRPG